MIEPGQAAGDLAEVHDAVKSPDGRTGNPYPAMPQTLRAMEPANVYDLAVPQNPATFPAPGSPRSRRAVSLSVEARAKTRACARTPPGVSVRCMWPHWPPVRAPRARPATAAEALPMGDRKREASVEIIQGAAPPPADTESRISAWRRGRQTARRKPCW